MFILFPFCDPGECMGGIGGRRTACQYCPTVWILGIRQPFASFNSVTYFIFYFLRQSLMSAQPVLLYS